jgi:HEPN domain-containing protein
MANKNVKRLNLILIYEHALSILIGELNESFNKIDRLFEDGEEKAVVDWSKPIHSGSREIGFALHIPIVVLLSFNVELSLKALLFQKKIKTKGFHNLKEYYLQLDDITQLNIRKKVMMVEGISEDEFNRKMEENNMAFVEYRYPYEKEEASVNIPFLMNLLQAVKKQIDWTYNE